MARKLRKSTPPQFNFVEELMGFPPHPPPPSFMGISIADIMTAIWELPSKEGLLFDDAT